MYNDLRIGAPLTRVGGYDYFEVVAKMEAVHSIVIGQVPSDILYFSGGVEGLRFVKTRWKFGGTKGFMGFAKVAGVVSQIVRVDIINGWSQYFATDKMAEDFVSALRKAGALKAGCQVMYDVLYTDKKEGYYMGTTKVIAYKKLRRATADDVRAKARLAAVNQKIADQYSQADIDDLSLPVVQAWEGRSTVRRAAAVVAYTAAGGTP
jgi:hypothetical protein